MRESFEIMSSHPLLTIFLGGLSIFAMVATVDVLTALIDKIPEGKRNKKKDVGTT